MLTRFALLTALLTVALGAASTAQATPVLDGGYAGAGFLSPKVFPNVSYKKRYQVPRAIVPQADGKIVVPISLDTRFGARWHRPVMRFNANGTPDATWGTGGISWIRVRGYRFIWLTGATNGAAGDIYAYGYFSKKRPADAYSYDGWYVVHIDASGRQDPNFGISGAIRVPRAFATLRNVTVGPSGRIFTTDATWIPPKTGHTAMRIRAFSPQGMLDRSYAENGVVKVEYKSGEPAVIEARDGVLVTLKESWRIQGACKFKRYLLEEDGRRDLTFGSDGTLAINFNPKQAYSMACDSFDIGRGGKLLIAGLGLQSPSGDAFVMRTDSSGRPDPTFGINGVWQPARYVSVYDIAELSDGSVMITGSDPEGGLIVGAITASGVTDANFGKDGLLNYNTTALLGPVAGPGAAYVTDESDYGLKEAWSEYQVLKFAVPSG